MKLDFPADFRASLLLHDGQEWDADSADDAFEWLPGQGRLASLDRIVEEWKTHEELFHAFSPNGELEEIADGHLFHVFWHPRRIPIAGNTWWDQDNLYLDMIPGPLGVAGQLAMFGNGVFGEVQGPGFGVCLKLYVEALEAGSWVYRDGACRSRTKPGTRWSSHVHRELS